MTLDWVEDAQAWFSHKLTKDTSDAELAEIMREVKPVRDAIWAYEKRLVALTGGAPE
jgi:hypothetical protein